MAGKATISFDQYKEVFRDLTALHKKSPTVKELQRNLGGGSTELLGKYRATLLLEEESVPQALPMKPTLAKAIQAEMENIRDVAVAALNETLRSEREERKTDFENIEIQNEERERAHAEAMEHERDQTHRANILVEERGREIDRIRAECTQHQECRRVAEVERVKAVAVCEAELAGLERERIAHKGILADLESEREARHRTEREHAVSRERIVVVDQRNLTLQQENERLQKFEETATQLPNLKATVEKQREQINDLKESSKVMSDLGLEQQGNIQRLIHEAKLAQRQCDEYKGRAEVAERMHLGALKLADGR